MITFQKFLLLGIEHIWTGYDHLLFLFGLLVVCRRFRSLLIVISCFTVAHSLTLVLSTLEVLVIPGRIIEPLIAATIIGIGVENLCRKDESKLRWCLAFAFGLIHGFGFASILRELGVSSEGGGLLISLFSFNLGVEIGQLLVAAVLLPLFFLLRKAPAFERRWVPALSAFIVAVGSYWLLERTIFF